MHLGNLAAGPVPAAISFAFPRDFCIQLDFCMMTGIMRYNFASLGVANMSV